MKNVGSTPLTDVYYMRTVDPDQEQPFTGNFNTNNYVAYQRYETGDPAGYVHPTIPNLCLVAASGVRYPELYMGLGSVDSHCRVNTHPGLEHFRPEDTWTKNAWKGYDSGSPWNADQATDLAFRYSSIDPGASVQFKFSYVLLESDLTRALSALEAVSINAPSARVSGPSVLFQITIDDGRNEGNCLEAEYQTTSSCLIASVEFYIYTSAVGR